MKGSHVVKVDGVFGAEGARKMALKRCVWDTRVLYNEFMTTLSEGYDITEFRDKTEAFIKKKALYIVEEKPMVSIKDDRYVVDVYFTVGW